MQGIAFAFFWLFMGIVATVTVLAFLIKKDEGTPVRVSIGETLMELGRHIAEDRNVYPKN